MDKTQAFRRSGLISILAKFKKPLSFVLVMGICLPVFAQSVSELDNLVQSRNLPGLISLVEQNGSVTFSPSHLGTRAYADEARFRTRLASFQSVQTTRVGYLMHSLFVALSNGHDPQNQQSEAFSLVEALKELKNRGHNLDPTFEGVSDAGPAKEFAVSGMVDTALMTNDQRLVSQVIPVLEALGFDQSYAFGSYHPSNQSDPQTVTLPEIGRNALFESSLGDQGVENSAQLFEAASLLFNQLSDEALRKLGNEERAQAEKAVDEIASGMRALGHEMSPQERSLMINRQLFLYDLPLRVAVLGGLDLPKIAINLFEPALGRSTAEETQQITNVRVPFYLKALQRVFGEEGMKAAMNSPFFPLMQPGDSEMLLYSPFGLATRNSVPTSIISSLMQLGGSTNERAFIFGQPVQVEVAGQAQQIQYPVFEMNQANQIMELALNGDVDTLRQMNLTPEEASSQSPTGFRPTALHMALAGAGARFQQTLNPAQQQLVLSNPAAMNEFLKPVVETTRLLLARGADPDTMSGYFGPEGQIWYNVTEGTPIEVANALAKALAADFDEARKRLERSERNGIPQMADPNSGVCRGLLQHLGRAGWLNR